MAGLALMPMRDMKNHVIRTCKTRKTGVPHAGKRQVLVLAVTSLQVCVNRCASVKKLVLEDGTQLFNPTAGSNSSERECKHVPTV